MGKAFSAALPGLKVIGMGLFAAVASAGVEYLQGVDYGPIFGPLVGGLVATAAHAMRSPFKRG